MKKGHNFLWPLKELFEILTVADWGVNKLLL